MPSIAERIAKAVQDADLLLQDHNIEGMKELLEDEIQDIQQDPHYVPNGPLRDAERNMRHAIKDAARSPKPNKAMTDFKKNDTDEPAKRQTAVSAVSKSDNSTAFIETLSENDNDNILG